MGFLCLSFLCCCHVGYNKSYEIDFLSNATSVDDAAGGFGDAVILFHSLRHAREADYKLNSTFDDDDNEIVSGENLSRT
jgi:hypothetical protein